MHSNLLKIIIDKCHNLLLNKALLLREGYNHSTKHNSAATLFVLTISNNQLLWEKIGSAFNASKENKPNQTDRISTTSGGFRILMSTLYYFD